MEIITVPSPSLFLGSPLLAQTGFSETAMKASPKRPPPNDINNMSNVSSMNGSVTGSSRMAKPKQSKSRNGCVTCKAKRLKCDETKPSCQQCHKRGVQCGGYKKDFKWRPFEEASLASKTPAKPKKGELYPSEPIPWSAPNVSLASSSVSMSKFRDSDAAGLSSPATSEASFSTNDQDTMPLQTTFYSQAPTSQMTPGFHSPAQVSPFQQHPFGGASSQDDLMDFSPSSYLPLPDQGRNAPRSRPENYQLGSITDVGSMFGESGVMPSKPLPQSFSGQSPKLIDLLSPGTDLSARPMGSMGHFSNHSDAVCQPTSQGEVLPTPPEAMDQDTDFDEEIVRQPQEPRDSWGLRLSSSSPSGSSVSSSYSPPSRTEVYGPFGQPQLPPNSAEMLMLRFDKQTCGILSIKDGPSENPWRTLVWPLARESPALYHAVSSMTAFHLSHERASLRVDGMEHMRKSIQALAAGLGNMRTDAALATTLALAFSESWDQHISTGIEHLRGAKILVNQALVKHKEQPLSGEGYARLKFLCNTFVYMDVIARLTSDDEDESGLDTAIPQCYGPFSDETEIDPLMGCATTLFPLIGCVANLARRIRKSETTTLHMIEQGIELKTQIENWKPGSVFEPPEDPTSGIQHCIQTAEAYRWATLLYLHQALPEIPSPTTAQLANKVLVYLATVPPQSRTVIIHIFPLLAAGCEAVGPQREWVKTRWEAMIRRLCIGNVDKCWEVTKEVWDRRDRDQMERARSQSPMSDGVLRSKSNSPTAQARWKHIQDEGRNSPFQWQQDSRDNFLVKRATSGDRGSPRPSIGDGKVYAEEELDFDLTVRGRLHWAGVMKEWKWEVLLG